jgi:CoA:oxalate CoA-transferase
VTNEPAEGPLTGITVLDFSRVLSGPHCGRMLVDMGADVVKIEPPEGDMTRFSWPRRNSIATYFAQQNVGKRNISLDLKRPEALDILMRLVDGADVVIENFRPGVMARLGLGAEALLARNPRLVVCSLTGYGQTGPWVGRRAYAPVVGAETGITHEQAVAQRRVPGNDAFSHADVYTAMECAYAIVAALFHRERSGRGQHIDVSMAETMLYVNEHFHWMAAGKPDESDAEIPSFLPGEYPVLPTSDGREVVVSGHAAARGTFERYLQAFGLDHLAGDERFATVRSRRTHLAEIHEQFASVSAGLTAEEVEVRLAEAGLAMGVLRSVDDIAGTDWAASRGAVRYVSDRGSGTIAVPGPPWHLSDATTGVANGALPAYRGEHNAEVLAEKLGLAPDEIAELAETGVLSSRVPRS